jgi:hypothetical protein
MNFSGSSGRRGNVNVVEVAELYALIKRHYPFFDASLEKVKEDHRFLQDFPADAARQNIERHIMTETATPGIAHIRGRLGEQLERQRMREDTQAFFSRVGQWEVQDVPPPQDYWESVRRKLRGEAG